MDMIHIWGYYNIARRRLGEMGLGPAAFTSGIETAGHASLANSYCCRHQAPQRTHNEPDRRSASQAKKVTGYPDASRTQTK